MELAKTAFKFYESTASDICVDVDIDLPFYVEKCLISDFR